MNAIARLPETSQHLEASVDQARALLDAGDLQAAKQLADLVYSSIKPLSEAAARLNMAEALAACYRIQGDALELVSRSEIRIADEWDRLAAEGKVARGRPKKSVGDDNALTALSIGLRRDQIHAARKLRDRETLEPGFIRRSIDNLIAQGLAPSKSGISHAIGTKSRSKEERGNNAYFTPIEGISTLLSLESFSGVVKEPACGKANISKPMEEAGYSVLISDLVGYGTTTLSGERQGVGDFLLSVAGDSEGVDIVTNPPYGKDILNKFVAHALREHKPRKMALLLNANFMFGCEDPDRIFVMEECPPSRVYLNARRLPMMHREGWDGDEASSQMNTAWFIWERNEDGSYGDGYPRIIRVDWKKQQDAPALAPGACGHVSPMTFRAPKVDDEFTRETPRRELADRVEEERARALIWIAGCKTFDAMRLRQQLAIRPILAEALLDDLAGHGLIAPAGGDQWKITDEGWTVLHATAAVAVAKGVVE
ncbi:hypothetical protein [Rhizobium sp. FKY42]|uniref:hypothetical protein n=1 Tax=Rhizobium sp. FKY42 TaxID=2562310 RepID=UPI0010C06688|nr:hypothetical protein [Rhizobium sp. FKY42]